MGLLAGFYRRVDSVCMGVMDALMAFPGIVLAVGIMAAMGPHVANVIVALSIVQTDSVVPPEVVDELRAIPGVEQVVQVPSGVAVVARDFWSAERGRDALHVEWDLGPGAALDTEKLLADYRALAKTPGAVALEHGDCDAAMKKAARRFEVEFDVPYLAHAPMEPLNCTAEVRPDRVDVWLGTQNPEAALRLAAKTSGLPLEKVYVHNCFLGGGICSPGTGSLERSRAPLR